MKTVNPELLAKQTQKGDVTLVLGAGVSLSVGLPNWDQLAQRVWEKALPKLPSPWDIEDDLSPKRNPQFLPIVFERAFYALGPNKFTQCLRESLYADFKMPQAATLRKSDSTLAVMARTILQEYRAGHAKRIKRVITLNADDLIEQAVKRLYNNKSAILKPITTSAGRPNLGRPEIPIYHVHGFLPHEKNWASLFGLDKQWDQIRQLAQIFTDTQYWRSASSILSFGNRTMGNALFDSRCLFIGLSMTDINVLRWLALRYYEADQVYQVQQQLRDKSLGLDQAQKGFGGLLKKAVSTLNDWQLQSHFRQHYWIRTDKADPSGFLSDFLTIRGVQSVSLSSWRDNSLKQLMRQCFPPITKKPRTKKTRKKKDNEIKKNLPKRSQKKSQ